MFCRLASRLRSRRGNQLGVREQLHPGHLALSLQLSVELRLREAGYKRAEEPLKLSAEDDKER